MYKYVPLWPERYLVIYLFIVQLLSGLGPLVCSDSKLFLK